MTEEPEDTLERQIRAQLQDEASRVRAPDDLWAKLRTTVEEQPAPPTRRLLSKRWLAAPALAAAGAVALLVLTVVLPSLGNDQPDAGSILTRAAEAADDPAVVGLQSYVGHVEMETTEEATVAGGEFPEGFGPEDDDGEDDEAYEGLGPGYDEPEATAMDVWFQAPNRFRFETNTGLLAISDGEVIWTYDPASNTYEQMPFWETLEEGAAFGPFELLFLTPIMFERMGIDDPIAFLRENQPEGVSLIENESVLGREAYLIISGFEDDGGELGTPGAESRLWLDKEFLVPLRVDFRWEFLVSGGVSLQELPHETAEFVDPMVTALPEVSVSSVMTSAFTSVEFNVPLDDQLFEFTPPPDASPGLPGIEHSLPTGALTPRWIPANYYASNVTAGGSLEVETEDGLVRQSEEFTFRLEEPTGGYVEVEQHISLQVPVADVPIMGQAVSLRGTTASLQHLASGVTELKWTERNVVITLRANELPDEDLLRLAESMVVNEGGEGSIGEIEAEEFRIEE